MMLSEVAEEHGRPGTRRKGLPEALRAFGDVDTFDSRAHALRNCDVLRAGGSLEHLRQRLRHDRRRHDRLVGDAHEQIVVHRIDQRELETFPGALAQPVRKQRMLFAQGAADYERVVEVADLRNRHSEPWRPCQLPVAAEISLTQAEVDVAGAEPAHQLLQQIELFYGLMRQRQRTDRCRAVLLADALQAGGHEIERDLPFDVLPYAIALHHRARESRLRVQSLVRVAVPVGEPALVHRFVLARQHPHHAVLLDLHDEIRAQPIVGTD